MTYPTFIELPYETPENAPTNTDNSDQFQASFVRYFIENHTKEADHIFDPFLGFGTTAFITEETHRIPYGIEADRERFEWAAGQLEHWNHITHGDSANMLDMGFPKMDLCITSPPYMPCQNKWNPLYGGNPEFAGYNHYLERMAFIFQQTAALMKKNTLTIVHADNLQKKQSRLYTPLVRDLSLAISQSLRPEAEIIIRWTGEKIPTPITHALIFKKI